MKKLFAIILTAVMLLGMIPLTALTATAAETEVATASSSVTLTATAKPPSWTFR